MILNHFDPKTKKYTRQSEARKDPIDPGKYLVPAFSTLKNSPVTSGNQAALFIDEAWKIVIDLVGQHYYLQDGSKIIISEFDEVAPDGSLTEDPPTEYHDSHNGINWVENESLKEQDALSDELRTIKSDMVEFMAYHFSMTQALFETLISKGVFSVSEIEDDILKEKYAEWKPKVNRYRELND